MTALETASSFFNFAHQKHQKLQDSLFASDIFDALCSDYSTDDSAYEYFLLVLEWKNNKKPLMYHIKKMAKQNSKQSVHTALKKAAKKVSDGDPWRWVGPAISYLIELRGVGPATASAILMFWKPQEVPFMSEELLDECIEGKHRYRFNEYKIAFEYLREKQIETGKSMFDLEQEIWAKRYLAELKSEPLPSSRPLPLVGFLQLKNERGK